VKDSDGNSVIITIIGESKGELSFSTLIISHICQLSQLSSELTTTREIKSDMRVFT
jgi:hypothetical protein